MALVFETVGPDGPAHRTQWATFAADPAGDGSIQPLELLGVPSFPLSIVRYTSEDGNPRIEVQSSADEGAIRALFKANASKGSRLVERKRAVHDDEGVELRKETSVSGSVPTMTLRNIRLLGHDTTGFIDHTLEEHSWL